MASSQTRLRVRRVSRRCESGKVSFATHDEALDGAEHMMERGWVKPGCHITPYQCDRCNEWHVGNRVIVWVGRNHR